MIGLVMSAKVSDDGLAPFADHVILRVLQVLLDSVFIHEVSIASRAIVMEGRMNHVVLIMLEKPEGSSTRLAFMAGHDGNGEKLVEGLENAREAVFSIENAKSKEDEEKGAK
jgi:hypothetical protein